MGEGKKTCLIITFLFFLIISLYPDPALTSAEDVSPDAEAKGTYPDEQGTPDWLKRVEISGQWESDKKPTIYFQTVQPLYRDAEDKETVFIQPRFNFRDNRMICNLGLGYRKVVSDNLLLGANIFGDYQELHQHARIGLGVEALGQILEARLNSYIGITDKRLIEESSSSDTFERVADGLDWELGLPIPYLPWLKIFTSGFWYDFDRFDDKYGWKTRLEAKVNEAITLEFYTWDDNKGEQEYGGRLRCNLAFDSWSDFKEIFSLASEPFPEKDLRKQILIPVERDFDIVVEKWQETGSMSVEIGRGT